MRSGFGKTASFIAGIVLVIAGAFDLYVGVMNVGLGEGALVGISRSFMLLFPGYAFLAYSLHPSIHMSSHGVAAAGVTQAVEPVAVTMPDPVPENVIVFTSRANGAGPASPGFRSYR